MQGARFYKQKKWKSAKNYYLKAKQEYSHVLSSPEFAAYANKMIKHCDEILKEINKKLFLQGKK